jgi:hypothetical protein
MSSQSDPAAAAWDAEYAAGRYASEQPVAFTGDILAAARRAGIAGGLYRLIHGDLSALPAGTAYPLLIGIQVFQHGDRAAAHAHIRAAQQRLEPGGLFCLRVNATATDVWPGHEVTESHPDGGFTVRYLAGPKQGLFVHFFTSAELEEVFADGYTTVLPPRLQVTRRIPPQPGQWSQWEAIWRSSGP